MQYSRPEQKERTRGAAQKDRSCDGTHPSTLASATRRPVASSRSKKKSSNSRAADSTLLGTGSRNPGLVGVGIARLGFGGLPSVVMPRNGAAKIVGVAISLSRIRNSGSDHCVHMSHLPNTKTLIFGFETHLLETPDIPDVTRNQRAVPAEYTQQIGYLLSRASSPTLYRVPVAPGTTQCFSQIRRARWLSLRYPSTCALRGHRLICSQR